MKLPSCDDVRMGLFWPVMTSAISVVGGRGLTGTASSKIKQILQ